MKKNIIFALLICISFLLPDFILGTVLSKIGSKISPYSIIFLCFFGLALSFIKNKKIIFFIIGFLDILLLIELNHMCYFGLPISIQNFNNMFFCFDEVVFAGAYALDKLYLMWGIMLVVISLQIYTAQKIGANKIRFGSLTLLIPVLVYALNCIIYGSHFGYQKEENLTLQNAFNVFIMWGDSKIKKAKDPIPYLPYKYEIIGEGEKNIVLIIGESTNTRFLSLYGYEHNTTPFLKSQIGKPNFAYTKGISSSIGTCRSIPLLLNVFREPQYISRIPKTNNLIKLSKDLGYNTLLNMCLSQYPFFHGGIEFFKTVYSKESPIRVLSGKKRDISELELTDYINTIDIKNKNFIVINPYAVHEPYEQFHQYIDAKISFGITDFHQEAYAKAVVYLDQWIENLVETIHKKYGKETLIIFASDHGKAINEEGMFGVCLHPLVADIAVFAFGPDHHPFLKWLESQKYVSHYDLGIKIAELIGVKITNLNDDGETRYIQDSSGNHVEFIPYKIKGDCVEYLPKQEIR